MIIETKDISVINSILNNFDVSLKDISVFSTFLIYQDDIKTIGLLGYDLIYDRLEITYIYVDKSYRLKGIASKMIEYMLNKVENKINNITLEVKENNISAIKLYEKFGFKVASRRMNYYGDEDALLMIKEMI